MTATRITDAAALGVAGCSVQYSSRSPFFSDERHALILETACFGLYDLVTLKRLTALPWLGDANEPLCSRTEPNRFYYHHYNMIWSCDVDPPFVSRKPVHTFSFYESITFGGESDISEDGDHIAVVGERTDGSREAFVYRISTGTEGNAIDIYALFDSVYITPDNNLLLSYPNGIFLFNPKNAALRQLTNANGHKAVTRHNGEEVMIWTNSNEDQPTLAAYPNGVVMVRLSDGRQTGLLSLPWDQDHRERDLAVHISAPRNADFCIVSTYAPGAPEYQEGYHNSILKVPLDGSPATVLCRHGSDVSDPDQVKSYMAQPRASVDAKGERFLFNSNKGGRTDVYLGVFGSDVTGVDSAVDVSGEIQKLGPLTIMRNFPNQGPLTLSNFPAGNGEMGTVFDTRVRWLIMNDGGNKWKIQWEQVTD